MERYKVLIAEDEEDIARLLTLYLDEGEFEVFYAPDGKKALDLVRQEKIDIALVDIMMPEMDGYSLIKAVRREYNMPIIVLSAKNAEADKILGLNIGADAYLTKPFDPLEVVAYVKASLRRFYQLGAGKTAEAEGSKLLKVGGLELDTDRWRLTRDGEVINLTSTELKILKKLMASPGQIFTKAQLYECISDGYYESDDATMMVHISNLRSKIEKQPSKPEYIKTVRGLGYKIEKI